MRTDGGCLPKLKSPLGSRSVRPLREVGISLHFPKLREVTLTYNLPKQWVSAIPKVQSARLSLSGRNLLTFTGYSGLDPEVSNFGNQPIARNIDVTPYPPSRTFFFTLNLGL